MRGLGRRNEYPVVILLARGAILCNSNFYCNVFVLKQEEQEVKRGLKRKFYDATPMLGLQEDDRLSSCALPRSKSGTGMQLHQCSCGHFHIRSNGTSYHLSVLCPVSFHPGEIYCTTYASVWCSLSMLRLAYSPKSDALYWMIWIGLSSFITGLLPQDMLS